ncbi:Glycosylphosphatidylinositol (GPI) anchor assembly protein [Coemansia thaxteri]|uniref:Glycosylphosphatidylinositol (GPI) anchor assembly protein n=1 Tax=Coemansia thaxteri TaxID=2663907 RepID=A0A9W8BEB1_9FUNG|nr:Glycosylphosphatidylinositol (GPI) anchor assembly protein [Coemansia thaxteri]KAJ2006703.1 Glycosylphosphatidylinositol (GPI) anchor assembly protein [Coemansia thaxteri]KAJ2471272.1 Glycosylphosphatidylinositol (GPI) anchor assembly protein [Coemansia sp. RSA 2322]KAJ2477536.1 Glycosylphosphatidylinositol (GPI) anchor assembly protein [Coemansia sp. RSA 2320]
MDSNAQPRATAAAATARADGDANDLHEPSHRLYPIDANGIELMLGAMASAMALVSPRKSLNLYDYPIKYLSVTSAILFAYYAILAFAGIYCFKVPDRRNHQPRRSSLSSRGFAVLRMGAATLVAALAISLSFVLFGAPFASQHALTFMAALNVALLGVTPAILTLEPTPDAWKSALLHGAKSVPERWAAGFFWPTMLTCWLSASVIPLDWDRPWQKWPIPVVGGAFLGNLLGLLYVLLRCFILPLARADYAESERIKRDMVRGMAAGPSATVSKKRQ